MTSTTATAVFLDARLESSVGRAALQIGDLPAARLFARSRTTETCAVFIPGFGPAVRKRWWWPRAADRAKGAFRTTIGAASPARREAEALERLRRLPSGPFGPRPLAYEEERRVGVLHACTLILEEIEGAIDLATFLRDERDPARRAAVLADLGHRTREMHHAGLLDREYHPRNVLVAASRAWKVDCPKQRVRPVALPPSIAVEDLAALDVGLVRLASPAERSAFLAIALNGPPSVETLVALDVRRARIDARESRRLPACGAPLPDASKPTTVPVTIDVNRVSD
ncbi:MAG: lipopolysaccharide kinase InaA family protein [Planctomycetes bacterium]|nr:lipopolysaccharide kinase InaA family protein [Planctomycetota bacterium]